MSAPVSMSACNRGSAEATWRSSDETVQPTRAISTLTTSGSVSTWSILPSEPFSYPHRPRSSGSRSEGVPLNPMRWPKSISPPRSWPEAESLSSWCCMKDGKTTCSSSQCRHAGSLRNSSYSLFICSSFDCLRSQRGTTTRSSKLGSSSISTTGAVSASVAPAPALATAPAAVPTPRCAERPLISPPA